ncbi:Discoidin domain-containing receptor 2 [Nymphon striatum]|nr:Discoidin domain-containing receptor 2 [Nymphon striatum]
MVIACQKTVNSFKETATFEGIASYSSPVGEERSKELDFRDKTHDGETKEGIQHGGLGQLTDGQTAVKIQGVNSTSQIKGFEWVGWKNDSDSAKPVELVFEFESVRNFSSTTIYCNNKFTKDTQVFSTVFITFSIGGRKYSDANPIRFATSIADNYIDSVRAISIPLNNRLAKFVKMSFTSLPNKWLLISEVLFDSVAVEGNFTEADVAETGNTGAKVTADTQPVEQIVKVVVTPSTSGSSVLPVFDSNEDDETKSNQRIPIDGDRLDPPQIARRCSPGVGVLSRASTKVEELISASNKVVNPVRNEDSFSKQYIGLIIGILAALIIVLGLVIVLITGRKRRRKQNNNHTMLKPMEKRVTINMKVALEDPYSDKSSFYQDTTSHSINSLRKLPEIPVSDYTGVSREYAVPDLSKCGHPPVPSCVPLIPRPPPPVGKLTLDQHYAATDVVKAASIQGVSGNTVYAVPSTPEWMSIREKLDVREFPREQLHFLEKLGEGQFGEVHLCEAQGIPELVDVPCYGKSSMLVAVKILRKNATESARTDFFKEIKVLSRLRDPNIVHVLGTCTNEEPLCMIVEYMEHGDLHQFLQNHVPETAAHDINTLRILPSMSDVTIAVMQNFEELTETNCGSIMVPEIFLDLSRKFCYNSVKRAVKLLFLSLEAYELLNVEESCTSCLEGNTKHQLA